MKQSDFEDALSPVFRVGVVEDGAVIPLLEFDLVESTVKDVATGAEVAQTGACSWNAAGDVIRTRIVYRNGSPGRVEFRMVPKRLRARGWVSHVLVAVRGQELRGWAYYPRPRPLAQSVPPESQDGRQ